MGDRPSPDRCDSVSGCYSWSPTTYPGGGGGRDSFRGRGLRVWGARRGETRGCPIDPASFRTPRRTVEGATYPEKSVWAVSGRRGTSWNTFMAMRWACVGVVPQRVEGLYLRLRMVSMCSMQRRGEAMGDFYWGSAQLLCPRSLILTQVAALAVWYQPVPGCLARLQALAESFCRLSFMWGLKYLDSLFPTFVSPFPSSHHPSLNRLLWSGLPSFFNSPSHGLPLWTCIDPIRFNIVYIFGCFFVFIFIHLVWYFCSFSPTVSRI